MNAIHITHRAVERYIERINGALTFDQAKAKIEASAPAILAAANFGCTTVRQGSGAKLVLDGTSVVTVLARGSLNRNLLNPIGGAA